MDFELDEGLRNLVAQMNTCGRGMVCVSGDLDVADIMKRASDMIDPVPSLSIEPVHRGSTIRFEVSSVNESGPYRFDRRLHACFGGRDMPVQAGEYGMIRSSVENDILSSIPSRIRDLTFAGLSGRLAQHGFCLKPTKEEFARLGFYTGNGRLNLTAYLLSDRNYVPIYVTRYGKYGNVTGNMDLGRRSLALAVTSVPEYVFGLFGEELPIDAVVFREVWTNACVHSQWCVLVPPTVSIYEDRIEVASFGGMPNILEDVGVYGGWSMPVNAALYNAFAMMGYTWHNRHGLSVLKDSYSQDAVYEREGSVVVRLPFERFSNITEP